MAQPNQSMMGLVLQNPSQNTHMLVNVAGSTGFIGQPSNSMNPMGNMVQMQPQNHPNLHPVSLIYKSVLISLLNCNLSKFPSKNAPKIELVHPIHFTSVLSVQILN